MTSHNKTLTNMTLTVADDRLTADDKGHSYHHIYITRLIVIISSLCMTTTVKYMLAYIKSILRYMVLKVWINNMLNYFICLRWNESFIKISKTQWIGTNLIVVTSSIVFTFIRGFYSWTWSTCLSIPFIIWINKPM